MAHLSTLTYMKDKVGWAHAHQLMGYFTGWNNATPQGVLVLVRPHKVFFVLVRPHKRNSSEKEIMEQQWQDPVRGVSLLGAYTFMTNGLCRRQTNQTCNQDLQFSMFSFEGPETLLPQMILGTI